MSIEKHSAVAATARGRFDVIQVPTPEPGEEEVLVQVQYSSVIAFDTYTVDSAFYVAKFPMTLGFNSAGTVVKIGSKVNNLKVGDKVSFSMVSGVTMSNIIPFLYLGRHFRSTRCASRQGNARVCRVDTILCCKGWSQI